MRRTHEEREYRRGLILGLTMAEVLILLLFLLLLTLSVTILRDRQRFADERASLENQVVTLERTNRELAPIAERLRQGEVMTEEQVAEMLSQLARVRELESALGRSERERNQLRSERDALVAALQQIDPTAPPDVTLRRAADAIAEARQLRDNLRAAQQRIAEQQSQLAAVQRTRDALVGSLREIDPSAPPDVTLRRVAGALAEARQLRDTLQAAQQRITELEPQLTAAQRERDEAVRQRRDLDDVVARARAVSPNAPPAATLGQSLDALAQQRATENASSSDPRRQVAELQRELGTVQRTLEETRRQRDNLMNRGGGVEMPSCFNDERGRQQPILSVTIEDEAIFVEDITPPAFQQHEMWQQTRTTRFRGRRDISEREFRAWSAPITRWSTVNTCRFFVRLIDSTCSTCKDRWNSMRSMVEGYFYIMLRQAT